MKIVRPKTRGWQLRILALIDSGCFVVESLFGPSTYFIERLLLYKSSYAQNRLKISFSFGKRDRVGLHLTLEDLFNDTFWKTSSHIWCVFHNGMCATRWTVWSAFGRVDFRLTLQMAVSREAYSGILKIAPFGYIPSPKTFTFSGQLFQVNAFEGLFVMQLSTNPNAIFRIVFSSLFYIIITKPITYLSDKTIWKNW